MGQPSPVIVSVSTPAYAGVVVETSDGLRHEANLSSFSKVYCFPKNEAEWSEVSIDSYGLGLVWASRFEVHVDQVISLAHKRERILQSSEVG